MALIFQPPGRLRGGKTSDPEPDAGFPAHCYCPERGKKIDIMDAETGKRYGKTLVSATSPEMFHHPHDDNKAYFEKIGKVEKIVFDRDDPSNTKSRSAGLTSVERGRAAAMFCGHRKSEIKIDNRLFSQTIASCDSPRWFKQPVENNREFFEKTRDQAWMETAGLGNATSLGGQVNQAAAHQKKHRVTHQETGQVCSNTLCSATSPEWMKQTFENNAEFFKDLTCPSYGDKHDAMYYTYVENPPGKRVDHSLSFSSHMVSQKTPRWMKSPILSNKDHFEKETKHKLQEVKNPPPDDLARRRLFKSVKNPETGEPVRGNRVSTDAVPEWMMPPKKAISESSSRAPRGSGPAQPSSPRKTPQPSSPHKAPQPSSPRKSHQPSKAPQAMSPRKAPRGSDVQESARRSSRASADVGRRSPRGAETERSHRSGRR